MKYIMQINIHMVENAKNDTKKHLYDSQYDCHLHLVRVNIEKLVLCHIPDLQFKTRKMLKLTTFKG